ncbi:hypothetical protein EKH55_1176 [Sinorhizobium alkalisoli]|nr:hypothetical protein EKH55_1176 [Sinorhizobium alkalisoli]
MRAAEAGARSVLEPETRSRLLWIVMSHRKNPMSVDHLIDWYGIA